MDVFTYKKLINVCLELHKYCYNESSLNIQLVNTVHSVFLYGFVIKCYDEPIHGLRDRLKFQLILLVLRWSVNFWLFKLLVFSRSFDAVPKKSHPMPHYYHSSIVFSVYETVMGM